MIGSPTRINKYICNSGLCSRKAADRFVESGVVFINNQCANVGNKVWPGDNVTVNEQSILPLTHDEFIVVAFNKPVGVVCTATPTIKNNIIDFVNYGSRLLPIGRLDKDSQGLILLTNRGELANKILNAGNSHEKEYVVTVNREITDDFIAGMSNGVPMLGMKTKPCKMSQESSFVFRITLLQGLNRQIRRMCKHFGYSVQTLDRARIMHIELNGLAVGAWRELDEDERCQLFRAVGLASL